MEETHLDKYLLLARKKGNKEQERKNTLLKLTHVLPSQFDLIVVNDDNEVAANNTKSAAISVLNNFRLKSFKTTDMKNKAKVQQSRVKH